MHGLVELVGGVKVDNIDVAVCCADDKEFVLDVHGVDSVLAVDCCDWILRSEVPVFDLAIPATGDEIWIALNGGELAASNGLLVS